MQNAIRTGEVAVGTVCGQPFTSKRRVLILREGDFVKGARKLQREVKNTRFECLRIDKKPSPENDFKHCG